MRFTVLGSEGFVGSNLAAYLSRAGIDCYTPARNDNAIFRNNLGHVIYCIGVTADFRKRPFDTVRAHVCHLANILEHTKFDSFLYLSSTRIYREVDIAKETDPIKVHPCNSDDLYNISKIMGESLCFSCGIPNVKVARISNIFGNDFHSSNFLSAIIRDAVIKGKIISQTAMSSRKDYISINDTVNLLHLISLKSTCNLYNVASGINIDNRELMDKIKAIAKCEIDVAPGAVAVEYPKISINRIVTEFNFKPVSILDSIDKLIYTYKKELMQ